MDSFRKNVPSSRDSAPDLDPWDESPCPQALLELSRLLVRRANRAFVALFGPVESLSLWDVFGQDRDCSLFIRDLVLKGHLETRMLDLGRGNQAFQAVITAKIIDNREGLFLISLLPVPQDTDKRIAEESGLVNENRDWMELFPRALFLTDSLGQLLDANGPFLQLVGRSLDELKGLVPQDFLGSAVLDPESPDSGKLTTVLFTGPGSQNTRFFMDRLRFPGDRILHILMDQDFLKGDEGRENFRPLLGLRGLEEALSRLEGSDDWQQGLKEALRIAARNTGAVAVSVDLIQKPEKAEPRLERWFQWPEEKGTHPLRAFPLELLDPGLLQALQAGRTFLVPYGLLVDSVPGNDSPENLGLLWVFPLREGQELRGLVRLELESRTLPLPESERMHLMLLGQVFNLHAQLCRSRDSLDESEALLRGQLDVLPWVLLHWGPDLRLQSWNSRAQDFFHRIFHVELEPALDYQTLGKALQTPEKWAECLESAQKGVNASLELDWGTYHFQWDFQGLEKGRLGVQVLVRDCTEQKQNGERIQEAQRIVESAVSERGRFLSMVSHELRTPLNSLLGFSDLLDRMVREPEYRQYVDFIRKSGQQLLRLIEDIVDLSRLQGEAGPVTTLALAPSLVMDDLFAHYQRQAQDLGITLALEDHLGLQDEYLLEENYFRPMVKSLLEVCLQEGSGKTLVLYLEAREYPEPGFYDLCLTLREAKNVGLSPQGSLESPAGEEGISLGGLTGESLGLGWALTKRYVELLQGRMEVRPENGAGRIIQIILQKRMHVQGHGARPPAKIFQEKKEPVQDQELVFPGNLVLVADDNPINLSLFREMLRGLGLDIREFSNGMDVIRFLEQGDLPDLIFADILMPGLSGFELMDRLAQEERWKMIPVVAMTALAAQEDQKRLLEHPFDEYLLKPYGRDRLLDILQVFLPHEHRGASGLEQAVELSPEEWAASFSPLERSSWLRTFSSDWPGIEQGRNLTRIHQFSGKLEHWARDKNPRVQDLARIFSEKVQNFDLEGMENYMGVFQKIWEEEKNGS